ncbi:glycerophosphodiester phosphodiesterase [Paenibacillus sp. MBLB4367]|uniref:glycerophosphodiester phosphodiesterase n=1 Tax=Paenibacillus sp. MBLB4367 TaxID=3384767 RepID=UPI003907FDD4
MTAIRPLIIAHRGASGEAPENTLGAFKLGLEQGCHAIELDVHLSKDGHIVVCHDTTLDRTTDRTGAISELTLAEIQTADAGSWFHEKYAGERIPTLEQVFELVPPSIVINVEIKGSYGRRTEHALAELLRRTGRLSSVVVSSFDHKCLAFLKLLEPEVQIGLLYSFTPVRHAALASLLGVPVYSLHPHFFSLNQEDVRDAVSQGLQVYPWTINAEDQLRKAAEYGVSGIITDYPGRLKNVLDNMGL